MLLGSANDSATAFAIGPEAVLAAGALILGVVAAWGRFRWLGRWEGPLARLARHKKLAILIAILAPLILRAFLLPWFPVRAPRVHDEFSFLLQADTLAHGRLANARHPLWVHFESEHILVTPVYASVFPLAQAVAIAVGQVLFRNPWAGVWLSAGLMCGAICWMLQGWLPPRWALLGALLVILRLGVSSYWMNSFWGGCVAAIGGALVLGALPRILAHPDWRPAIAMGAGWLILANSRTFEGAVFSGLVAFWLLVRMLGKAGPTRSVAMRQVMIPLLLMGALIAIQMGYYFARVTGKPWTAPYVQYRSTATVAPHFMWQKPRPEPLYNNQDMRHYYVDHEIYDYRLARESPWNDLWRKLGVYWRFYIGPILLIPLLTLPWLWRDGRTKPLLWIAAAFSLALAGQVWHNAHYAAPATGLAILIVLMGMRRLRPWRWRDRPVGLYLVRCLPLACLAMLLVQIGAGQLPEGSLEQSSWRWTPAGGVVRANIQKQLAATGERHLVMVRYAISHETGDEWVYNNADIDTAPVIWARELDRASNQKLLAYFHGRKIWLIEPDTPQPRLVAYQDAPVRPMPFVQLGAPGIAVLHSPEEVRQKVLARAGGAHGLSCDQWNFFFTDTTGVQGPVTGPACYEGQDRDRAVGFDHWFSWLRQQR